MRGGRERGERWEGEREGGVRSRRRTYPPLINIAEMSGERSRAK